MTPVHFNEVNARYGAPQGYAESQVMTIPACNTQASGGSLDGHGVVVVAWLPTDEELEVLKQGKPIFLTMCGGLVAHYLSTSFYEATHPA